MKSTGETIKKQKIWESLILPKDYQIVSQIYLDPMIFFIITGSVDLEINNTETHSVFSFEMFMGQINNSYKITMLEQTHLLICHVPMEAWYDEQKWIDNLALQNQNVSEDFFKLRVKKVIARYLSLLDLYLKEGMYPLYFFELKRRELFFLLFFYYQKKELAQFFRCIISKDIRFEKYVMDNYINAKNVQELAKSANYSTSGFIKKFQKCFNDSPYQWMQKQKAKQIYVEINRGSMSLQEIANKYKFSSYQHFLAFCKSQLGSPPTEILAKSKINR